MLGRKGEAECPSVPVGLGLLLPHLCYGQSPHTCVPLPALPCPRSPFPRHVIPEAVFPKGPKSRREGGSAEPVSGLSHAGTHQPHSVPPSPEKEAFKKRQKLQQDNGEETDENEVEEVSGCQRPSSGQP